MVLRRRLDEAAVEEDRHRPGRMGTHKDPRSRQEGQGKEDTRREVGMEAVEGSRRGKQTPEARKPEEVAAGSNRRFEEGV